MAKALINGTAYEIDHGNTRVNGTNYTIDHGITRVNGTNYNIALAASSSSENYGSWPGWSSATWQDINNLCKAKQNGDFNNWPSDVIVGSSEKTLHFSSSNVTSLYGVPQNATVRVRALDELPGTITFSILYDPQAFTAMRMYGNPPWSSSTIRDNCNSLYNELSIFDASYVVPVIKRTYKTFDYANPQGTYQTEDTEEYFFLPAVAEIYGHSANTAGECPPGEGTVYNNTVKQNIYRVNEWNVLYGEASNCWTRSLMYYGAAYTENGYKSTGYGRLAYLCPFFIIGNPNAS